MATFKLTLFTKRDCEPCKRVKNYLRTHNYLDKVNILEKENHPALVSAFDLDVYPTLVVSNGVQMIRKYEGANLCLINLPDEIHESLLNL